MSITSDGEYPVSVDLNAQAGPLIVRLLAMVRNGGIGGDVVGQECAAWWCVNTYASNVTNGTLHEHQILSWTDLSLAARTSGSSQRSSINLIPPTCPVDGKNDSTPPQCEYWVGAEAHRAIQNYLSNNATNVFGAPFLTGSATEYTFRNQTSYNVTSLPIESILQPSSGQGDLGAVLQYAFDAMLQYMTVDLRTTRTSGPDYPGWQYGRGYENEAAFEVQWAWLAFPIAIVSISLIFLVSTIIINRDDEIWKSSILAMMFHSFEDEDRKGLGDMNSAKAMKDSTRNQKVQLERQGAAPDGLWIFRTKAGAASKHDEAYGKAGQGASKVFGHGFEFTHDVLN